MVAAAVVGAGIGGALISGAAAGDAADTQAASADRASQLKWQQYQQNREDLAPYRQAGYGALNQLSTLLGIPTANTTTGSSYGLGDLTWDPSANQWTSASLRQQAQQGGSFGPDDEQRYQSLIQQQLAANPTGVQQYQTSLQQNPGGNADDPNYGSLLKPFSETDWQADPGYQFRLDQGQQALERSAAARGGLLSGGALKDIDAYSQGLASQEYQNAYNRYNNDQTTAYNRLAGVAGTGQTAINTIGANGAATAGQIGSNIIGAGNAAAAGTVGAANALNSGISQGISSYQTNQLYNMLAQQPSSVSGWGGTVADPWYG